MGRVIAVVLIGSALCVGVAYNLGLIQFSPSPKSVKNGTAKTDVGTSVVPPGDNLYAPRALAGRIEPAQGPRHQDPIAVTGTLASYDKVEISSKVEGTVEFVGEEVPVAAQLLGGVAPFLASPCYVTRFPYQQAASATDWVEKDMVVVYRRLLKGDVVEKGQMVVCLNPVKAATEKRAKETEVDRAEAEHAAAHLKYIAYKRQYESSVALNAGGKNIVPKEQVAIEKATYESAEQDSWAKRAAIDKARRDLDQAQLYLSWHFITNQMPTAKAVIKDIAKDRGEGVKPGDKILELQSFEKFTAEGRLDIQFHNRVKQDMRVTIEPSEEDAPLGRPQRFHRGEVTSVAFSNRGLPGADRPADPLIVSGSEDHSILVWDRRYSAPLAKPRIQFKDPVRVVACSPQGCAHNVILAGCADGSIYYWDLDNAGQTAPIKILSAERQPHSEAVTSLGFSPDGRFFASGSENASIKMWDMEAIRTDNAIRHVSASIKDAKEWAPDGELQKCMEVLAYNTALKDALKAHDFTRAGEELDRMHKELKQMLYPFDAEHGASSGHYGPVTSLTFTPQCRLISASRDNTLRVWALKKNGVELVGFPTKGRKGDVSQLGVSGDGNFMLFDQGKTLQILAVEDGRTINTLQTPDNAVDFQTTAIFSPDSSLLLTAGASDGRLQLWSTPSGTGRGYEVRQFVARERSPVTCAAFAPVGNDRPNTASLAVSGSKEGFVYLWPIPSAEEVHNHPIRDLTLTSVYQQIEGGTRHIQLSVDVRNQFSARHPQGRLIPGKYVTIVIHDE